MEGILGIANEEERSCTIVRAERRKGKKCSSITGENSSITSEDGLESIIAHLDKIYEA